MQTSIRPAHKPARVLIDLQAGMPRERMAHDVSQVLATADAMLQAFHAHSHPVVLAAWGRSALA